MKLVHKRRTAAAALVALLSLALSACLFAPGRFGSALDVKRDGSFRFSYAGELYLMPLMKAAEKAKFTPEPCYDDETGEARKCNSADLDRQRSEWEAERQQDAKGSAAMMGMFGGVDPGDPEAPGAFAETLLRQKGWRKVEYMGDGKFEVDFMLEGRLDHDFLFPTIEGFPMANALVQVSLRDDGSVRIDAPGYGAGGGMMGGMAMRGIMSGAMSKVEQTSTEADADDMPAIDGTFTITTDAQVLANNTDEGPQQTPVGQTLTWKVNNRTPAAPTALLRLAD
ncbi:hypothetical protein B2G71_20515 [Novosphingobium sp. PC22D]|uniref:hypothetical protein n=1 Tax=Novosphingobium sp. PC22D TaxID=1962403 RepID=UPI000BEFE172|nr:hypothetical protein [Novosphingobium sp. PC22D]PEQ10844.1 hypothetical protein B2G71_20515 [Novosphingobium sp. PC22D]